VKQSYHPTLPGPIGTGTMTQSGLIVSSRDGNVAIVKLNRPEKRNALSQDLIDELIEVLSESDKDVTVRAVVLTGSEQGPFSGMSSAGSKRAR
jgi:enoyl-CoA hydratase/carnithine racemase